MYAACKLNDKCLIRAGRAARYTDRLLAVAVHLCPYSEYPPLFYIHTAFNKSTNVLVIRRFDVQRIERDLYFDYANFIRASSSIYFFRRWSYKTIIVFKFSYRLRVFGKSCIKLLEMWNNLHDECDINILCCVVAFRGYETCQVSCKSNMWCCNRVWECSVT